MDINTALHSASDQIASMQGIAQANNAWSAEQAKIQREWQEQQNAKAMEFNQDEAAKNRNWQELMSNTAHQREVRDLMAAGLNPVLSAMNGNGASVGSGATAQGVTSQGAKGDTDTSTSGAIANLLGSILSANTQIEAANINARTQEAVAEKYTAMEQIVANISAAASRYGADQSASASRYGADQSASASRYHSDRSYDASMSASERSYLASIFGSQLSSAASRYGADQAAAANRYHADQARAASEYGARESANASRYSSDTSYDIKKNFGNGEVGGLTGMIWTRLMDALGFSDRSRSRGTFNGRGFK